MVRILGLLLITCLLLLAGCADNNPRPVGNIDKNAPGASNKGDEHGHKPSAHGGIIIPIGSDSYHAEAVFEKGGTLRLYTLGQNETVVLEVAAQTLTGYARIQGGTESESFMLEPIPQAGDREGMTSLFVGTLPAGMGGKKVDVTIPAIRIGQERFRLAFQSAPAVDTHAMPAGVVPAEEEKLYLTPAGKYTVADIKANGNTVPSVKFKGLKAQHDVKPKPGDKLCPISMTKANPQFSWVVGGKTYEFCCPPCLDEFVSTAKEKPDEIQEPEFYRKK
jgi:YHS domain-containing protein